jgi:putative GTP pyrophosphokinase
MKDITTAIKWYEENRPKYVLLARKVEGIIKENLEQKRIQYHSVTSRPKSLENFKNKAQSEKYDDPINQIKDMAGIRVITYLESDVTKVAGVIRRLFDIDKDDSLDQSQLLGSDKLGYRSVHYVATFNKRGVDYPNINPTKICLSKFRLEAYYSMRGQR